MQGFEINQAEASDAAEILELQRTAYQTEAKLYNDFKIPPLAQGLDEIRAEFGNKLFLKAVLKGRIGGSVRAYEDKGTCYIGRLIVHPKLQRRGLGTALMKAIEARFNTARRYELFTGHLSFGNLSFYATLGYKKFKERPVNDRLTVVWLSKLRK